ncbi:hypothetical protein PG994_011484 [Apiospora phragmitis]|uniref:Uncharacterized protein n=1 Tax=Apiospora phragmitis TaxID=2905665 RepID=A0ABR1TSY3_9PEZI
MLPGSLGYVYLELMRGEEQSDNITDKTPCEALHTTNPPFEDDSNQSTNILQRVFCPPTMTSTMMAFLTQDKTRVRLRREICDVVNDIGSVDNCNVLATIDKPETCTSPPELKKRLRDALAAWLSLGAAGGLDMNSLVYDFGDYISGQALALGALSPGGEATQFHCLQTVADELNCEVFLVKLKREDYGFEDNGYDFRDFFERDVTEDDVTEDDDEEDKSPPHIVVQDEFDMEAYDDEVDEQEEDAIIGGPNEPLRALDEATIIEVLQLAIHHNHAQLFDLISNNIAITLSPGRFFTWAGEHLRNVRFPLGALALA